MRNATGAALAGLTLAAAACGGDNGTTPGEPTPVVALPRAARVAIDQRADTFTSLRETHQFTAVAFDSAGQPIPGDTLLWSSTIPSLVTINPASGAAIAQGNGPLFIRVNVGTVKDSVPVVVKQVPARLAFELQPANIVAHANFNPAVLVALHDARGYLVLRGTDSVSVRLVPNAAGALLAGIDHAKASAGIAQFSALSVDRAGAGLRLVAVSGSLPSDTSVAFDVSAPGPTRPFSTRRRAEAP